MVAAALQRLGLATTSSVFSQVFAAPLVTSARCKDHDCRLVPDDTATTKNLLSEVPGAPRRRLARVARPHALTSSSIPPSTHTQMSWMPRGWIPEFIKSESVGDVLCMFSHIHETYRV
ncbi:hypothetical protein BC827DRAFT_1218573 [Russula dissimulans]|nr:hypothetical protein BC827DRAFT_1218573 [Russula dissimulans]